MVPKKWLQRWHLINTAVEEYKATHTHREMKSQSVGSARYLRIETIDKCSGIIASHLSK